MVKYVALLRGINVGTSVRVPMKTLQSLFESLGLSNVITYLNSGNVIFDSKLGARALTPLIENALEKVFGQKIPTLIRSASEMIEIEKALPAEWNNDKTEQTYVAYLFDDAARPELVDELPVKKEYMNIFYANKAIIWNIKRENYNRSHINRIIGHRSYSRMTTRNANTARKLAELCGGK